MAAEGAVAMNMRTCPTSIGSALLLALAFSCASRQRAAAAEASTSTFSEKDSAWLAQVGSRGVRAHDPSTIVRCKSEFWVFYTGRGIPSYHSKDLRNWEPGPRVFTNSPAWVSEAVPGNRNQYFWAPDIIYFKDRYLLYYSVSTFGKNTSAIGLASNSTLDPNDSNYLWKDEGIVIQSQETNDFNTIDPSVTLDGKGGLWLAFGSFWAGIKLVQLDPTTGKRISADLPKYSLAYNESIEAACIYPHGGHYYLFVNWGRCCRGVDSTYNIRVGRSVQISGPYLDANGKDLLNGGGTLVLNTSGPFIGPGHAGILSEGGTNFFSCHFYDGTRQGTPTLAVMPLSWTINGWPEMNLPKSKSD
jgi:arabinan endo-1,5-alpha-L-arabinosidase